MRRRISIIILSLALLLLFPTMIHGADTSGDTGNVNFIVISALHKIDGRVVPYDHNVTFSKGQTKTLKEGSPLSMFGKKDYQFGYMGVEYKFLNGVYLADTTASCDQAPIYSETLSFKNIEIAKPTEKWALVNLIITLIILLMSGAFFFVRQKKHEDDDNESAYKEDKKDLRFFKILGLFIAIITILVFLFTEDLSLPMQLIDKWTIIMLLFFIDQIFVAFVIKRSARGCEKDEEWVNH